MSSRTALALLEFEYHKESHFVFLIFRRAKLFVKISFLLGLILLRVLKRS